MKENWLIDHGKSLSEDEVICLVGDTGGSIVMPAFASAFEQVGCTQVRLLGDLMYPYGISGLDDPELKQRFLAPFEPLFAKDIPFYLILGNHDYRNNTEAWLELARQHPQIIMPNYYYGERWGDMCFISLDTTHFDKLYRLGQRFEQGRWFKRIKKELADSKLAIVLGHHPLFSCGPHDHATPQLQLFLRRHILGRCDAYLAGHEHILSYEREARDTHFFVAATGYHIAPVNESKAIHANSEYGFLTLQKAEAHAVCISGYTVQVNEHCQYQGVTKVWQQIVQGQGLR